VSSASTVGLFEQLREAFGTAAVKQLADHRAPPGSATIDSRIQPDAGIRHGFQRAGPGPVTGSLAIG
jgi:hypothetical protein